MPMDIRQKLILIALILTGAILRFWNIGFQHMNWDEEWTISFAGLMWTVPDVIIKSLSTDCNPPLYYLAAHFSMIIFGQTATAIRIPSAIAGILLIPVMYYIGREYKDELFGLLLAAITTIFYNFIFYSKYGRSYSIALLFFSIAFYYFIRLLKGDKKSSIPFGIVALLCLWTHLYTVIPIGIMILYLLWERKVYLYGIAITIIGSLPLLNYFNLITQARIAGVNENIFGETPLSVLLYTPLDIFAFSAFILFPIIVWALWKYRQDKVIRAISIISLGTWISMMVLAVRTPVILHYAMFLVPMLLIAFTMPFYFAIKQREVYFHHYIVVMVIVILEAVQILALATIQRGSW
jgi:uncharacterized membrane protein